MLLSTLAMVVAAPAAFNGPRIEVRVENKGRFVISTDSKGSPKTVKHIVDLVKKKFYDGQTFHRVENWVVQWGDPGSRTPDNPEVGDGGSGKDIPFEESKVEFVRGTVGVASTGLKVGGDSQLFILTQDAARLNGNYAVVGRVTAGMEVVDVLERNDRILSISLLATTKKKRR